MSTITHERTETQKKIDADVLERVKRGIAWLEEQHGPDWVDHIDMAVLDLREGSCCVLGQVYADEGDTFGEDGYIWACGEYFGGTDAEEFGFSAYGWEAEEEWDELDDAWHQVLTPMVERAA